MSETRSRDYIAEAVLIIESDVSLHFTIKEIAEKVGTNPYSLKLDFKETYGMGPYEYLLKLRLEKATELLLQSDHPISLICRQVGYKYPSSFIIAFRKKYGVTPLVWKKKEKK